MKYFNILKRAKEAIDKIDVFFNSILGNFTFRDSKHELSTAENSCTHCSITYLHCYFNFAARL